MVISRYSEEDLIVTQWNGFKGLARNNEKSQTTRWITTGQGSAGGSSTGTTCLAALSAIRATYCGR